MIISIKRFFNYLQNVKLTIILMRTKNMYQQKDNNS